MRLNDEELKEFITNQYNLYGHGKIEESNENDPILQKYELQKNHWLRYITVDFISDKTQWQILIQLYHNKLLNLTDLTKKLQAKNRDDVSAILKEMLEKKLIVKLNKSRNVQYSLSKNTKKTYFTFDSKLIGTADDVPRVTRKVVESF
ncbi:MAG: MarR family transcriptional regulator [Nitrosopumilus sp.]